jgi:hypothetical protein
MESLEPSEEVVEKRYSPPLLILSSPIHLEAVLTPGKPDGGGGPA